MNINELTIGQAREIASLINGSQSLNLTAPATGTAHGFKNGDAVIVRSRDAGVLFGEYAGNDHSTVYLTNAVQMWKWFAAKGISLIDVATYGVKKSDCKFSTAQASVTVFNACALIAVTDEAAKSIRSVVA